MEWVPSTIISETIRPNGGGETRPVRNVVVRSLGAPERALNVRIAFASSVDVDIQQPKNLFSRRLNRLSGRQRLFSLISREELFQRVGDFFERIYPMTSYAFLHEPTIREQSQNNTLDQCLALAIVAIAKILLSPKSQPLNESVSLTKKAETIILDHLERPSTVKLQALILIIHYHIQTGRFSRAYMLTGLAARAATALRLNYERPELSFIAQETRRRVLWALTAIDGDPGHAATPRLAHLGKDSTSPISLLGVCIRLSKIQKDIMRLTRQLALSEQPLVHLSGLIQEIQKDLWRVQADVELSFGYQITSSTHLIAIQNNRWFTRYLQISITWHQSHCDLYRLFLPGYPEAAPKIIIGAMDISIREHAVRQCHEHVERINQILSDLQNLPPTLLLPHSIAICAYHATRLTLFLLSSPDVNVPLEMRDAITKAHTAAAVTETYFSSSPSTKQIVLDLQRLEHAVNIEPESIYRELCGPSPPFDQGFHRHGHLAIHSLVRQANFVDDGYD
ncbi:hypothetical protein N7499_000943 [Penicillium canescens]|uniref:Xylanolytic transcriptional activator regulatory domain-containing protein n=1 Tax=Penicillium canescens TaxID=5083 RepID=A0AAD6N3Y0_PENCN|nr:uncharacterized protein N7446_004015 [Penicillium canescens]KAJ6009103.1 hypothetical protein N7522_004119 [Penicillium canescens]KAJ6027388.1 hypothetical protein N7460_012205 [Penicillium canescens]KAJ6040670.1 hypothetical protein N7444_009575 [Penicillium canescens]KAJ6066978.1 hypothetical protein N7446_004015 [Penicillium canescens]KAJ6101313.1 hypothetical protein N7499_000943 [Penicillium canescens]